MDLVESVRVERAFKMPNVELTNVEIQMLIIFIDKILEKIDFSKDERERILKLKNKLEKHL